MYNRNLGTSPSRTLVFDTLHVLHLGVLNSFARLVFWKLLRNGAYGAGGTLEEIIEACLQVFQNHLKNWYRARMASYPQQSLTKINDVTRKMVGDAAHPKMATKVAETWGLLFFS